jgi:hypothetical protein
MKPRATARPLAFLAGLTMLVAACGPAATPTPAATDSTAAPITQAPAGTSAAAPTFALPSIDLPSGDEELEGLLPDEIAGEAVTKLSMTGESFMGTRGNPQVEAVLEEFNKTPADLSVAFGGTAGIALIAYRLKGVDGSQFFNAFLEAAGAEGTVTVTDEHYGGKAVKKVVSPDADIGTVYVYTSGDVMFILGGATVTEPLLTEAFSKLD